MQFEYPVALAFHFSQLFISECHSRIFEPDSRTVLKTYKMTVRLEYEYVKNILQHEWSNISYKKINESALLSLNWGWLCL